VVKAFPSRCAHRKITHQADGAIREAFGDVDHLTMGMLWVLERASGGWIVDVRQLDPGLDPPQAGLAADPLVTLVLGVKAISGEGVAEGTNGTSPIIIAASGPEQTVAISGVAAQVHHSPCAQVMIDGVQKALVAIGGVPSHTVHHQIRISGFQLEQQGCRGNLFPLVGWQQIAE
jgi:hypothetical protein